VQLFHHSTTGGFLLKPLEYDQRDISCSKKTDSYSCHHWANEKRNSYSTNRKQEIKIGNSAAQILVGQSVATQVFIRQRTRKANWRPERGNRKLDSVITSRHPGKMRIGKHLEWVAGQFRRPNAH
jgi:hypothetical protein